MADVQNQAPEGATQGPTIGIADLQNAIKVIDYACEQGAFKGWQTIEQVAAVRTKLAAFVQAALPKEDEAAPAEATDAAAVEVGAAETLPAKVKAPKTPKTPTVKKVSTKPKAAK